MNLVKNLNMEKKHVEEYIKLIKRAQPKIIEIKGYMSVGYARERLGYDRMPTDKEMRRFVKKLVKKLGEGYKLMDSHERSRAYVVSQNKEDLKISKV